MPDIGSTASFQFDQGALQDGDNQVCFYGQMYGLTYLPVCVTAVVSEGVKVIGSSIVPIPLAYGDNSAVWTAAWANTRYRKITYGCSYGGYTIYEPRGLAQINTSSAQGELPDDVITQWQFQLGQAVYSSGQLSREPPLNSQEYDWVSYWVAPNTVIATDLTFLEFCGSEGCLTYSYHPSLTNTVD